jgi:glycosyltransferase involved in cell wall biosynthesis
MRIVLAANVTVRGGVWRHVVDLASNLQGRGCDVALALPADASRLTEEARKLSLRVIGLTSHSPTDVWHLHLADTYDRRILPMLLRARCGARAVVITEHLPRSDASDPSETAYSRERSFGSWPAKTLFKRAEYRICNRVVCVSEASRRFVMIRYGVSGHKAVAIPNGITAAQTPASWPQGPPLFVAIGAVIVQKGFDVLMEATALARRPWRVEVIGEGASRATLRAQAEQRELPIQFTGPTTDVTPALAAATALVVPSRWEASSYVSMEAMALGRPVVASRVDSLPEIVVDGVTGLLVSPGDPEALAGALDRLAADPGFAELLGKAGRERVKSFGLNAMVDALLLVYREVLGNRQDSAAASHRG